MKLKDARSLPSEAQEALRVRVVKAVRDGRVFAIDGNQYLNRSGPRLVESAELLAYVIWDEQLGLSVDHNGWRHVQ